MKNAFSKLKQEANKLGAKETWLIDPDDIVVEERTTLKCEFGCDGYGSHVCPPFIPEVAEFKNKLNEYESSLLVKWKSENKISSEVSENFIKFEKSPPKDLELAQKSKKTQKTILKERKEIIQPGSLKLEKKAWQLGYNMALAMFPGMCAWCATDNYTDVRCAGWKERCKKPTKRRPCLMGLGIRMDKTLSKLGIEMKDFPLENEIANQFTIILLN